ncbi:MAG TPA: AAA family ATPase [Hyphomicrobiaceae bacterium]|nr:AAA family ATPase [Hyphomicrobiaceae bacterium]
MGAVEAVSPLQSTECRRILILGSSGAGKSTLADEIGRKLTLPVIHLDKEFWLPGWVEPEKPVWRVKVAELVQRDAWVMDGNYSATLDIRLPRADAIIWLDLSRRVCLSSAIWRTLASFGRTRPDMAPGCPERIDIPFFTDWIWNYPTRSRPGTLALIERERSLGERRTIVLGSRAEVRRFVAGLPSSLSA